MTSLVVSRRHPLARARQAKGRQGGAPQGDEPPAARPPVAARFRAQWARLEDVEKVVRLRASDWLFVLGGA
jgi:hypothetical protein